MKCLPSPYGWPSGIGISLTTSAPVDKEKLSMILEQYSCYPPVISRVISSLEYSNRYDCRVQEGWYKNQHLKLKNELKQIGVTLKEQYDTKTI